MGDTSEQIQGLIGQLLENMDTTPLDLRDELTFRLDMAMDAMEMYDEELRCWVDEQTSCAPCFKEVYNIGKGSTWQCPECGFFNTGLICQCGAELYVFKD